MKTRILAAVLVMLAAGAPAFAGNDGLDVFRKVEKQVLQYPHFTIFDSVSAEIDNGVVTLTGKVTMPYKRTDIERRVARIDGIHTVNNRITVLPVSQFDDELRFRIARAIYSNPNFQPYAFFVNPPIHVIVEHGRVTLEGVVQSNVDRMLARSIASGFLAFKVENALKTVAEAKAELEKI